MEQNLFETSQNTSINSGRGTSKVIHSEENSIFDFIDTGCVTEHYKRVKEQIDEFKNNQAIRSQIKIDKLKKLLYVKYPKDLTSISNYFIQKYEVKTHEKEKESLERQSGSKRNFFTNSKVKSFVLYNESSPIDPLVDIKISLIIDEKNINCYDEKVYIDLIGIHHSQLDDFDRLMNVWDFLMMIRSLLNIQPFTPLDLALSIEGTSEVVLLKYVFSRILETIIKDTYQNDNNFELSYYCDLTDHEKLPGYLIYFLSNFLTTKPNSNSKLRDKVAQTDFYSKFTHNEFRAEKDHNQLFSFIDVLEELVDLLYDCDNVRNEIETLAKLDYICRKDSELEACIYGSTLEILSDENSYNSWKDLEHCIKDRINKGSRPWKIGELQNLTSSPFKSITFLVYPTHRDIIFCRCKCYNNNFIWKLISNPIKLNELVSGYSFPKFKNNLNIWINLVLKIYKPKTDASCLASKRYPYLGNPLTPIVPDDIMSVFHQFHSVVENFKQIEDIYENLQINEGKSTHIQKSTILDQIIKSCLED